MGFGPFGGEEGSGEYIHVMFECWEHWKEGKSWPDMMMSVTACDAIMCLSLSALAYYCQNYVVDYAELVSQILFTLSV